MNQVYLFEEYRAKEWRVDCNLFPNTLQNGLNIIENDGYKIHSIYPVESLYKGSGSASFTVVAYKFKDEPNGNTSV